MFEKNFDHEIALQEPAFVLAGRLRVRPLKWKNVWILHLKHVKQSIKRVYKYDNVESAASNTDLRFLILHLKTELEELLKQRKLFTSQNNP